MAEYLIQSETLDDIADAINAKTGGASAMTPAEMVTAIAAIPTGSDTLGGYLSHNLAGYTNPDVTRIYDYAIFRQVNGTLGSFRFPNATLIGTQAFYITTIIGPVFFAPNAIVYSEAFKGCTGLKTLVCRRPVNNMAGTRILSEYTRNAMTIERVEFTETDATGTNVGIGNDTFVGNKNLTLLILRSTTVFPLAAIGAFTRTPYDSDGTGGTIYIPKVLYDHLGDGTSLDYKAATNWSTIDSYGTITWAQIEGSIYETQYADGTPIPSE